MVEAPDWFVVLVGRDKRPIDRGWQSKATADPDAIKRALRRHSRAGLAVLLGASGLAVLDVEGTDGGAHVVAGHDTLAGMSARLGLLPTTATAATPSGGIHLFFRDPGGIRSRQIGQGVEIRAGTALVCLPTGSRTPRRRWMVRPSEVIADLPAAWISFLKPPPPPPPGPPITIDERTGAYARAALEGELRTLASAAQGGRNGALHIAAVRLGSLSGAGLLDQSAVAALLERAAAEIGLPSTEARPTIRSGLAYGLANPREIAK